MVDMGRTGYTFDVGDAAGLVNGVRLALANRDHLATMGQTARAFAETQSWPEMMDEVVDLYVRLLQSRSAKSA